MDDRRFDALARSLATPQTRRRALRALLAACIVLPAAGTVSARAQQASPSPAADETVAEFAFSDLVLPAGSAR